jgi:hypothetical protein
VGNPAGANTNPGETFGQWVTRMLRSVSASQGDLARTLATKDMVALRPKKKSDRRIKGRGNAPKPDVGKICADKLRAVGPVVAYRYGAALERMGAPCSGLDALIMAQRWPDAIGCIGELMRPTLEELPEAWGPIFASVFNQTPAGPLPSDIYPHLDLAWVRWITEPDPTRLPPTFFAAYELAKTKSLPKRLAAASLLNAWQPLARVDMPDFGDAWKTNNGIFLLGGKPQSGWLYHSEKKAKTDDD